MIINMIIVELSLSYLSTAQLHNLYLTPFYSFQKHEGKKRQLL